MLITITNGEQVVRTRMTSFGLYAELYRVSEMTGREGLKEVTVVPEYVWETPHSYALQLPIESLIPLNEWRHTVEIEKLHPAMTL